MKRSESTKNIAKALNACQQEVQDVFKSSQGYGYKYASLDKVYDEIRPKMTKHGLSLSHQKSFNRQDMTIELHSILMHESGEWIEYFASLPFVTMKQMNDYQSAGSGFTYLERYQTSAIFAITSDEDNGAHGEQGTQKITEDQAIELLSEADDKGVDMPKFLAFFGIQKIEDMPASQYSKAMAAIQKKAKK